MSPNRADTGNPANPAGFSVVNVVVKNVVGTKCVSVATNAVMVDDDSSAKVCGKSYCRGRAILKNHGDFMTAADGRIAHYAIRARAAFGRHVV